MYVRASVERRSVTEVCYRAAGGHVRTQVHTSVFFFLFFLLRRKGFICASWCDSDSNSDVAVSCESVGGGWEYEERYVLYWLHVLVIHLPLSASKLLLSSLLVIFHRLSVPFLSPPVHTLVWRALYLVFVFVTVENNLLSQDLIWLTHHWRLYRCLRSLFETMALGLASDKTSAILMVTSPPLLFLFLPFSSPSLLFPSPSTSPYRSGSRRLIMYNVKIVIWWVFFCISSLLQHDHQKNFSATFNLIWH